MIQSRVLAILICAALTAGPFAAGGSPVAAQGGSLRFVHRERSLQPGEVIFIEAESPHPVRGMTAEAFGREFPLVIDDGRLRVTGLLGIDLETKPGTYSIKLTGINETGSTVAFQENLAVVDKEFPARRLAVKEKYVSPPSVVLTRIRQERETVDAIFASSTPERLWHGPFRLPVPGAVISEFGKRSIYNGQPRSPHAGVDFRGRTGTPIRAPNAGMVALASRLYYTGKTVIIDHGMGLYSYFGHMSAISVKEGNRVEAGQVIGKIGATGLVTGPHLHWTVRLAGARIDPLSLVSVLSEKRP